MVTEKIIQDIRNSLLHDNPYITDADRLCYANGVLDMSGEILTLKKKESIKILNVMGIHKYQGTPR